MTRLAWLGVLACAASTVSAQQKAPPADSVLAAITARGRSLAAYDYAAWHGTDAVLALGPRPGSVAQYIARHTSAGWVVAFGRMSVGRDTFFVAYEAKPATPPNSESPFVGVALPTPVADTGYYCRAARAMSVARADFVARSDFGPIKRPYNIAALPAPGGKWWVYLFPAPTVAGVWPLGADIRYLVSGSGRAILASRRLHNSVIEFRAGTPPGDSLQLDAGFHTAVLDDIPEDTDVFLVLTRTPRVPEYVATDVFMYRIDTTGVITLLGRTKDVLRK